MSASLAINHLVYLRADARNGTNNTAEQEDEIASINLADRNRETNARKEKDAK